MLAKGHRRFCRCPLLGDRGERIQGVVLGWEDNRPATPEDGPAWADRAPMTSDTGATQGGKQRQSREVWKQRPGWSFRTVQGATRRMEGELMTQLTIDHADLPRTTLDGHVAIVTGQAGALAGRPRVPWPALARQS